MMLIRPLVCASAISLAVLSAGCATATSGSVDVVRYKIPASSFPISNAVEVPAGANVVYLSGKVPQVVDKTKPANDPAAYGGDTEQQTIGILKAIEAQLKDMGLSLSDVVKMQAFLVADPSKGGKMDFAGFMRGYSQFFGTAAQPNLPARSAFQIAALNNPAWFVEIEVMAVRGGRTIVK
ncbi:RidA family protein [Variovorax paradoxus]|nr:RidA family protein [Variovorax paradoxus]